MTTSRTTKAIVTGWLPALGANPQEAARIADAVDVQMDALPSPLRLGVRALERTLSVVPEPLVGRLTGLPISGEFVRLVRTLATVVHLSEQESGT